MTIQKGTKLIGKSLKEIEQAGGNGDEVIEGAIYTVLEVDDRLISVSDDQGGFTLEPDHAGLSYATFFTVKEA